MGTVLHPSSIDTKLFSISRIEYAKFVIREMILCNIDEAQTVVRACATNR